MPVSGSASNVGFRVWPDRIVLKDREKEEISNTSGAGTFGFGFIVVGFCSIAFVIVLIVNGWYFLAVCLTIMGGAILVALAKGAIRAQRRATKAALSVKADDLTRQAVANRTALSEFSETVRQRVSGAAGHLSACKNALATHARATFWDEFTEAYNCICLIRPAIASATRTLANYSSCLAGQRHNFPTLAISIDFTELENVFHHYHNLLDEADKTTELVIVFEQRRQGQSHAPTFKTLRNVSSTLTAELKSFQVDVAKTTSADSTVRA